MKEIWCIEVAVIQNVKFQHAAPLGVKKGFPIHLYNLLACVLSEAIMVINIVVMKTSHGYTIFFSKADLILPKMT